MKRLILLAALPALLAALVGCDPKGPPPPTPKTSVSGIPAADGTIHLTPR